MSSEVQGVLRQMENVRELLIDATGPAREALLTINRLLLERYKELTSQTP